MTTVARGNRGHIKALERHDRVNGRGAQMTTAFILTLTVAELILIAGIVGAGVSEVLETRRIQRRVTMLRHRG